MKNPNWDIAEAFKVFGKSPCMNCPNEEECAAMGLEFTCESFLIAEDAAIKRLATMEEFQ